MEGWKMVPERFRNRNEARRLLAGDLAVYAPPRVTSVKVVEKRVSEEVANWFNCLRRRSQKNRRMGWDWFEALTARWPLPQPRITHPWTPSAAGCG
jgi:RNA-directed DNA polymerase